jgi:hypothetical protein
MAIFQFRTGEVFPIFFIHPSSFPIQFFLLISIRNVVSMDEIQKQGVQEKSQHQTLCGLEEILTHPVAP